MSAAQDNSQGRTPSGYSECHCRCRIACETRCSRLETGSDIVSVSQSPVWSIYNRPFCQQEQCTDKSFLQLSSRPGGRADRRADTTLGEGKLLCVSSVQSDQQVPQKDFQRGGICSSNLPSMEGSAMVLTPSQPFSLQPSVTALQSGSVERPLRQSTPISSEQLPGPSRLESLRHHFTAEGISENTTDILLSAQRASTRAQYKSCWSKWDRWCVQRQINPLQPSVKDVLHFLTEIFEQGKQYATINTVRSAISSTVPHVDGAPVGQHRLICKFMKGVFNKRTPQPRYTQTWDVSLVTSLFNNWPENDALDLKQLSKKCAMLLALTSAKRQSDLHAINLQFMRSLPEGVEFKIPGLTKTRAPGKDVIFFFPSVKDLPKLCPVLCLTEYLKRTQIHRSDTNASSQLLFLSVQKPFSPISATSIGRWLKDVLKDAGVDTNVFKAHSTRSASSSTAKRAGVSIADILIAADWSRDTTFNRFYYRESHSSCFGRAVLS